MMCSKCGAEVPEGKLICDCFQADADNETEKRALEKFALGSILYVRTKGSTLHLLPLEKFCLTLCRNERVKRPSTRIFYAKDLKTAASIGLCAICRRKAEQSLKDAPFQQRIGE